MKATALAQGYLNMHVRLDDDAHVEFFSRTEAQTRLATQITELSELAAHEVLGMHPVAAWTRESLEAGALLIRGGGVVRSLAALYDYCWMTASEPKDVPRSSNASVLDEQQRAVLRLLATGAKDSAIARTLGISTRTVTRVVGELSTLLGATSRFQAGVRAARLGWID